MAVRKRPNGKWQVDFIWVYPDGRRERIRRQPRVNTKREAQQFERTLRGELLAGTVEAKTKKAPTFTEWKEEVMKHARTNNRQSTVDWKQMVLDKFLEPAFGKLRLDEITTRMIESQKATWLLQGSSNATVNRRLQVLSRALTLAVEWDVIEKAPKIRKLKEAPVERHWLSNEEAVRLLSEISETWYVMALVAIRTGLRASELVALRWIDVDLLRKVLHVRKALVMGVEGPPKAGKDRVVPLTQDVVDALNEHPKHLKSQRVFCRPDGSDWYYNSGKKALNNAAARAGLPHIGWHSLRHTFASHLVSAGVPLPQVQKLCGHSDIRTTMRYAHVKDDELKSAIGRMAEKNPLGVATSERVINGTIVSLTRRLS